MLDQASLKNLAKLSLAVLVVSAFSLSASWAWTCSGTLTVATGEGGTGTSCGGSYSNTLVSDDSDECLQEVTGDHISHTFTFPSIPGGTQYLIWEGHRPTNTDGDDFKFSATYDDGGAIGCLTGGAAVINHTFEQQGGTKTLMCSTDLDSTFDFTVFLRDTVTGSHLDSVYVDYLAICTE
jgi:hypothetical protein